MHDGIEHLRAAWSDSFGRIVDHVEEAVGGLTADDLAWRPDEAANPIGWLAWHTARVQDDHMSEIAGRAQAWTELGFVERLGFGLDADDIGYAHTAEQVALVRPDGPDELVEYLRAVTARTREYLDTIDTDEPGRIVDRRWDPPVTASVRIVSVIDDGIQHAGQAAYVRGMLDRRRQA